MYSVLPCEPTSTRPNSVEPSLTTVPLCFAAWAPAAMTAAASTRTAIVSGRLKRIRATLFFMALPFGEVDVRSARDTFGRRLFPGAIAGIGRPLEVSLQYGRSSTWKEHRHECSRVPAGGT